VGRNTKLIHLTDLYIFTHTHLSQQISFSFVIFSWVKKCDETTSTSSTSQHHIKHTTGSFLDGGCICVEIFKANCMVPGLRGGLYRQQSKTVVIVACTMDRLVGGMDGRQE
jgi:hypothetical protein